MIGKVRFCSGKVRSKVRQRAVLSPCQCGSGAGIHNSEYECGRLVAGQQPSWLHARAAGLPRS